MDEASAVIISSKVGVGCTVKVRLRTRLNYAVEECKRTSPRNTVTLQLAPTLGLRFRVRVRVRQQRHSSTSSNRHLHPHGRD